MGGQTVGRETRRASSSGKKLISETIRYRMLILGRDIEQGEGVQRLGVILV